MHGHMNERTPRRNTFFKALLRVHNELTSKYTDVKERIKHNYNEIIRKTQNKYFRTDIEELKRLCIFYGTTERECQCGDNKLESANFNIDIPCYHQIFKGAKFKPLPEININKILVLQIAMTS